MSKEKLIPELRFPEFENDGEWELKNVEEFFNVGSSKRVLQKDWTNEGVPFYRTRELVSLSKNEPFGSEIYISEELYEELKTQYGVPTEGDYLVSGVGTLGISYQVKTDDKFYFKDGNVLWFKLEGDLVSSYFKYCFESEHIQKQIVGQTSKSTVGTYTITNAKKTEFWYTDNPKEQQKIASCLSSLDELIAAHKHKLDALKDHKKGLLQNLFPQEGETVPKLRFPEFEGDGEWELKPFSKFIKLYRGSSPRPIREFLTEDETGVNWIKIGDTSSITDFVIRSVSEKITLKGAEKSRRVKKGELILANSMSYGSTYLLEVEGCIYDGWFVLREYEQYFDKEFLLQLLNSEYTQGQYKKYAAGGIVQNISSEIVYSITLPKTSKEEQQKIASCLSAVDELITAQREKIEQLQQHKKGLMQGLFPKIES